MHLHDRLALSLLAALALAACSPPPSGGTRPTAATILEITPASTQNLDATATAYAVRLIPSPTPAGLYVVQPNDTLSGLAEDFGTTVEELMAANNLPAPNAIQAGQTLLIPSLISGTLTLDPAPSAPANTPAATAAPTPASP